MSECPHKKECIYYRFKCSECAAMSDPVNNYPRFHKKSEWITMPEWFDVKEALPVPHDVVLCYYRYEPESPDVICENTYHGGGLWLSEGSRVTHWMALPPKPECFREE